MMKSRDLERVVQMAWRTYGRIDALVCNAGYGAVGAIDTLEYAQMNEQLAVNTLAPAELIRLCVPLMRRQGYGAIIGISSVVGRTGFSGFGIYSASKFALEGLFESLSMELAVSQIRVKLVEPSGVNTPFWDDIDPSVRASRGMSAEVVAAVVYRAANDSSARLRYPLGQTRWFAYLRRILPERVFLRLLRRVVTGK
jgi:short-subunit dehydrogenase